MSYDPEPEIKHYLAQLSSAANDLPKARRRELLNEIEQHIRQNLADTPCANQAEMLTLLDQVGEPAEIAAAASDQPETSTRSTAWEMATILLLLLGGFIFLAGWLVGVALLWSSSMWTLRDKVIGTLVIPGGLAAALMTIFVVLSGAVGGHACGSGANPCTNEGASTLAVIGFTAGSVLLLIAPLVTAVYLKRQKQPSLRYPSAAIG